MKAATFTSRLLTLALAVGPVACHQSPAAAQDKDAPAPSEQNTAQEVPGAALEPPKPPTPPARPDFKKPTPPAQPGAAGGGGRHYGSGTSGTLTIVPGVARSVSFGGDAAAAVIATSPMSREVQDEWREDLNVMDRLLRKSAVNNDGDSPMGLKLVSGLGRMSPMYVEGAGVILSTSIAWPLAPGAEDKDPAVGDAPRERPSKWALAKREVRGEPMMVEGPMEHRRQPYDADRVETLSSAILSILPEATNFRHLKAGESVFVTISGINEDGAPVRLTLKAAKADIDAAAKGTIDAEAFKQRVTKRIG
jgi:hypothetical protein